MIKIAPSILSADFSNLFEDIKKVSIDADMLHIDVMDGMFVPNISFGTPIIKSIRNRIDIPFDVHLMIDYPERYIDDFIDAGADIISVHVESTKHLDRCIQKIKEKGKKAAVALNPATSLDTIEYVLPKLDMVLLMTVNPGFGGQSYIEEVSEKIIRLRDKVGKDFDIQVDGGIGIDNIEYVTKIGANVIVSGTSIFKSDNPSKTIKLFREKAYKG